MNRRFLASIALAVPLCLAVFTPACGDDEEGAAAGSALTFTGESELFPGFDYSTGLQPASSPVQASFTVTAQGVARVTAQAIPSGSDGAPVLTGTPGTGAVSIEGGFGLEGQLIVDISGLPSYDGPIPGIENVSIPITGSAGFDPFAIGTAIPSRADIPPSDLPSIPLPGGIPGQLALAVGEGSFVEVSFTGTCAGAEGRQATYSGTIVRGGSLVIEPSIEIDVPVVGTQTFEIPSFTVDLALGESDVDMTATIAQFASDPGSGDVVSGSCGPVGTGGGGAGGGTGGVGGGTGGTGGIGGSGGTGGSGGSGGGSATVEIDGVQMTVTGIDVWGYGSSAQEQHVFIQFFGPGFSGESDLAISFYEAGSGCDTGAQVWLRPDISNPNYPDFYVSNGTAGCGLILTNVPYGPGENVIGSFNGWLDILNAGDPPQAQVTATFDAPWAAGP